MKIITLNDVYKMVTNKHVGKREYYISLQTFKLGSFSTEFIVFNEKIIFLFNSLVTRTRGITFSSISLLSACETT